MGNIKNNNIIIKNNTKNEKIKLINILYIFIYNILKIL